MSTVRYGIIFSPSPVKLAAWKMHPVVLASSTALSVSSESSAVQDGICNWFLY